MNSFSIKKRLSPFQIIFIGFAAVILIGALILMLPVSSQSGEVTPFSDAVFTSTSAVCVTGLVVRDTGSYWSVFGQSVILLLIQIGGLGVVTVAASLAMLSKKKISLSQRSTMQEAVAAHKVGGVAKLTRFILTVTFSIELIGALLLMPVFCTEFGLKGIWYSFFHSISAFCNAGFDILGTPENPFSSLTGYMGNPLLVLSIVFLIVAGGIGFLTWEDIKTNKFRVRRYRMQSKVILLTSFVLILFSAVYFYIFEYSDLAAKERILASLFQAVTPRTAGFNTTDHNLMTGAGRTFLITLMLIGGSPGSTAGGMKTTTFAVLFANAASVFKRKEDPEMFGRRIEPSAIKNASAILILYITLFLGGAVVISIAEGLPITTCIYETASAVGTVGLSLGLTPTLGTVSRIVLILLMFLGRVGGLTVIYAALSGHNKKLSKLPQERITVG